VGKRDGGKAIAIQADAVDAAAVDKTGSLPA